MLSSNNFCDIKLKNQGTIMKTLILIALSVITINSKANFNTPISFAAPLSKSCSFISDENVLATIDSLTLTLSSIRDDRAQCQSIFANSKVYLDTITSELISRSSSAQTILSNKETLLAQVFNLMQEGAYTGQYDNDLLTLQKLENEYTNTEDLKNKHLSKSLALGEMLLTDLKNNPDCDDNLGNLLLRPSLMLMGQVGSALYPGSSLVTSGVVSGLTSLFDSFISYAQSRLGSVETTLNDLISSKNYYKSYKCAYKNLNVMTCDLRQSKISMVKLKELGVKTLTFDTEEKDFKRIENLRKHYPRIQIILNQIKEIYETAQQQETIVEIASIQKETTKFKLLRPNPYGKTEWTDADQNVKTWRDWNMSLGRTVYLSTYTKTYCKIYSAIEPTVYNNARDICKPASLLDNAKRSAFIVNVIVPSLAQLDNELIRLSKKLRESVNVERLYYAIRSEEDYQDRIKYFKFSEVLSLFANDLNLENRPAANNLFSVRIEDSIKAMRALVDFKGSILDDQSHSFGNDEECDISKDEYFCKDFKSLSQAVYTFLAKSLSGGDVLSVETIDATFYNYISGVEDYFLNGISKEFSLQFSRYTFHAKMYRTLKKYLLYSDGQGTSDLPLMNRARMSFEKVFGYEIIKKLNRDVKIALRDGPSSDFFRDAIHSCAIYYPMLDRERALTKNVFRRKKIKKIAKKCRTLLERNGGINILIVDSEKFPLSKDGINYKNQCYYRRYEQEVLIKKTTLARELEDDLDLIL